MEEIEDSVEALASKVSPAQQSLNQVLAAVTNWAVAAAQSLDLMDSFLLYPAARSTQPWKISSGNPLFISEFLGVKINCS